MKLLLVLLTLSASLFANPLDELDLLSDLNNASEISTKTKLNINKTPSIVSVLHAKELKKLGITNLFEALETVPGIQTSIGSAGAKQVNMRGNKSLTRDKLKVMINDISINNEILGASYVYMDMPIENIERIEVIRGPASTIYGSYAHIGVINVITKSSLHKKNTYFINTSSEHTTNIGFTQNIDLENINIALNASLTDNDNSRNTGPYTYTGGSINQATSFEDFRNSSVGGIIKFGDDFSLQTRFAQLYSQNYYGYGDWPETHDPKKFRTTSILSEILYTPKLSSSISLDLRAGYKQYKYVGFTRLKPWATTLAPLLKYDLIADGYYKEHTFYSDNTLKYSLGKHDLLFGLYLSQSKEDPKTDYYVNYDLSTTPLPTGSSEATTVLNQAVQADISRYQYAFYFNDIYTISDKFIANLGLRYDHYNDVDSNLAHKLALLYNHDEAQNYKLMYQRSFRVPAWLELYGTAAPYNGNASIKPETIDTFELAYHHKSSLNSFFNTNIFFSRMKNYITSDSNSNFFNDKNRNSYGAELEFRLPLFTNDYLQANYSYADTEDSNGKDLPFVSKHLANIMFVQNIDKHFSAGSKVRYVGKQKRELSDPRVEIAACTTFDQTLTYTNKDLSIQVSVKNLFDEDIIGASPLGNGNPATGTGTYTSDYRRDGRTFWISAQWSFE